MIRNIPKCLRSIFIARQKHKILTNIPYVLDSVTKRTGLFLLIMCVTISTASAQQVYSKIGEDSGHLNRSAVMELESKNRGFLPPRMTKEQLDKISSPVPIGLQVWCTDCNFVSSTTPPSGGEPYVYLGEGWVHFTLLKTPRLSTGKRTDPVNKQPVRLSSTSATIKGTLLSFPAEPTEIGVVYREIIGNDFDTLPVLDDSGTVTAPNHKVTIPTVTTENSSMSVDISGLDSAASPKRPFSFRTYAKNVWGIGYGNPVIFNTAPPVISDPVITSINPLIFGGTLTAIAGTPAGTISEYGYWSSTTKTQPSINDSREPLSTPASIDALNAELNADSFAADPTVDLAVKNYKVPASGTASTIYFCYYVIANGNIAFSKTVSTNLNLDTGGDSEAVLTGTDLISKPFKFGEASTRTMTAKFNVTRAGSYKFEPRLTGGATKGITMPVVSGKFLKTGNDQAVTFTFSGTPDESLDGNTFSITKDGGTVFNTGKIEPGEMKGHAALCDPLHKTAVMPVISSKTGKVWMDRNLGASKNAKSADINWDDVYDTFGGLYQWGRGNDGHASMNWGSINGYASGTPVNGTIPDLSSSDNPGTSKFITNLTGSGDWRSTKNDALWQGVDGMNNPCPAEYRVPSITELNAEFIAYNITDKLTAYNSELGFPAAGQRYGTYGNMDDVLVVVYLWSSTPDGDKARYYRVGPDDRGLSSGPYSSSRGDAYSVRCIREK